MKRISPKAILVPTVSLFVICLIISVLLAVTNALTADAILRSSEQKAELAMKSVCGGAQSFAQITDKKLTDAVCYEAKDGSGMTVGWAVSASAKGYGGDVSVMVGIDTDGKVTGVEILSHSETPGLGANCVKEQFRSQFLQTIPASGFEVVKDSTGGSDGRVDALTGATITSNAVKEAVNYAVKTVDSVRGGEG